MDTKQILGIIPAADGWHAKVLEAGNGRCRLEPLVGWALVVGSTGSMQRDVEGLIRDERGTGIRLVSQVAMDGFEGYVFVDGGRRRGDR